MSTFPRLVRTLAHLRLSQLAWRAFYRMLRPIETRNWFDTERRVRKRIADVRLCDDIAQTPIHRPAAGTIGELVRELRSGYLTLLNAQRSFRGGPDWCMTGGRSEDRLWKYNLHYHGWLSTLAHGTAPNGDNECARLLADVTADWLKHCRIGKPGFSHYAWNSYAIATRLNHWRQTMQVLGSTFWRGREALRRGLVESLALQASYLHVHLEWDLRGNHLVRDAVGLASAGRLFAGPCADRWMRTATQLAVGQAGEQMLADGGHFERSPFYHLEVMDDWLSLALLLRDEAAREMMRQTWQRAAYYASWLRHPDGRIAQLNDGGAVSVDGRLRHGEGIGVEPDSVAPRGARYFEQSGVVAWHGSPWTVFFDVGEIGPDCQPGHAHADTLTRECSFKGKRLFVDPGCYSYDNDEHRRYDRATSSHNTVCVDRADSSEVWHIFRVGRRARPAGVNVYVDAESMTAEAWHDGYHHMDGSPRHGRTISVGNDAPLTIIDRIDGKCDHEIEGGFLLGPDWAAEPAGSGWQLSSKGMAVRVRVDSEAWLALGAESRPLHPDYGVRQWSTRLTWRYWGPLPITVRVQVEPF